MNKDSSKIVLMANDKPGLAVAEFLQKTGENILRLYLHARNPGRAVLWLVFR